MKKFLSIILTVLMLVSVLCVAPVSAAEAEIAETGAAPETLYLNAGVWDQAGAIFRAWVWGGSDADKWIYFTDEDGDGIYEAPLGGTYTGMKVLRAESGSTEWTSWNDSGDQTIPTDGKNMLVVEDWSKFSWSTYVAPAPVQPGDASAYYLMGTLTDWATGQNMVYAEDTGVVTTTLELEAGNYELKIKKDNNWMGVSALTTTITAGGTVGGTDNVTLAADGGTYTFNFTIAAKALEIAYTAPEVEEPTETPVETPDRYTVACDFLDPVWDPAYNDMTFGEYEFDGKVYDYALTVADVAAGQHDFKVTNGTWEVYYPDLNYYFLTTETGSVTVYFNSITTEIAVDAEYIGKYVVESITAVGNGYDTWLNDATWDQKDTSNDMTEVAPGVYEITYYDVYAYDDYRVSFAVNHSWEFCWDIAGIFGAVNNDSQVVVVEQDGSTVTLRIDINGFDFDTRTGNVITEWTVTPPEEPTEAPATEAPATDAPEAETMTIYFSNNMRWEGTIYAYAWDADNGNAPLLGNWCGTAMNYVDTNEYGEDIYSIEVPVEFDYIIFNDGKNQTKDIPASALYDGVGVYVADTEEGFGTYTYEETPVETEAPETEVPSEEATEAPTDAPTETPTDAPEVPAETYTVYFVDYVNSFTKVYAYAWTNTDNGEDIAVAWPGVEMELTGEALSENAAQAGGLVYSATFDKAYENIIFSGINPDGESTSQTADLIFEAGKYCYWGDEGWYDSIADIEAAHPYVEPSTEDEEPAGEYITVYFQNNWKWSDVCCYFDGSEFCERVDWPGTLMDYYDNDGTYDVYSCVVPADATVIVFNGIKDDGTGNTNQTPDITEGFYDGICYYMMWNNGNAVGSEDISVILPDMGGEEEEDPVECEHEFNSNGVCYKCGDLQEGVLAGVGGYNLVLGGKIGFNLYIAISDEILADENAVVVVTVPTSGSTTQIEIPISELEYNSMNNYKVTCELAAKEMSVPCNITIKTDSIEYDLGDYAIKDYCVSAINSTIFSDQVKEVAKTMLNYGAAAQLYFDYNTDNLANDELSAEDKVVDVYDISYFAPVIEGEADVIEFYGASLVLESDTDLKFYFKVDESKLPEGAVPGISINDIPGAGLERNGNLWTITMPSLAAHELQTEFVLRLSTDCYVTYSAYSYLYTAQQSGKTELVNLANALVAYANAAGVYGSE